MKNETWDEYCSRGIFWLVLISLIFTPLAFAGTGPWEFLVVQALTIGVMALWAVRLWVSPKPQFLLPPVVWPIMAFVVYAIGRYLTADVEYTARLEFIQVLVFAFLFLAILNNLYHQDMAQTITYVLIFLAMATASYAVAQYLKHSTLVWNVYSVEVGRGSGTFMSADHFCAFLEMILPLVLAFLLVGRIKPETRVMLGYSFLVILAGVTVTFSRAGWAATVVGLLVVLLILIGHRNHRTTAALSLAVLVGGGTVFVTHYLTQSLTYLQRITTAKGGVNLDIFVRSKLWLAGWHMWLDHLWWGVGPGLYDTRFHEYRPQSEQLQAGWAHCDYLNLLTDWGIVGGLMVLAGMTVILAGVIRTWRRVRRSETDFGNSLSNRFAFFLGALGGLAALAVHCLVDFNLHVPADALVATTLLALLSSNLRFATESYWHNLRVPLKCVGTLVLAAGMGYLGWQEYRLGHQAYWLARAGRQPIYTVARAEVLQNAFAYEPKNALNTYNIGECYRATGFIDTTNSQPLLDTAMQWYQHSQSLNPHLDLVYLREGNTLDYLERNDEAAPYYDQADAHDPNGAYTAANIGWHYMQARNYTAARIWLERSANLQPLNNAIVDKCMPVVERELTVNAGGL